MCRNCQKCSNGEYPVNLCGADRDTVCAACHGGDMIFLVDTSASMASKAAEIAAFMKAIVNSPETQDHTRYDSPYDSPYEPPSPETRGQTRFTLHHRQPLASLPACAALGVISSIC